uniref:hypothetical protein n=1 Tax=Paractinoplanes polyasparticus TaxID=2856853 RepID=UPI001C84962C|nr:hypothetical protein [Actinoplanes polyasparticus]
MYAIGQVVKVDCGTAERALRLLIEERVMMLVPDRKLVVPAWMRPAIVDGSMMVYGVRRAPVESILDDHPVLYVSGTDPSRAATAARMALDESEPGDPIDRQAPTVVRVRSDGVYEIHRRGAQDQQAGADDYLSRLQSRYGLWGRAAVIDSRRSSPARRKAMDADAVWPPCRTRRGGR